MRKRIEPFIPFAVVLMGLLLSTPPNVYLARQTIDAGEDLLDSSWLINMPEQLLKGAVSGRDFVFTYGPLYQLIHCIGGFLPSGSLASILRFQWAVEAWLVMLCAWFVLRLTGAPLAWRSAVYLLWACFWSQWFLMMGAGLKPLGGLFCLAICGYSLATAQAAKPRAGGLKAMLIWALATPILLLYAFDMGVMTFLSLTLSAPALWLAARSSESENVLALRRLIVRCFAAAFITLTAMVALLSLSKGWGRYLPGSLELAAGYAVTLPFHIGRRGLLMVALAFLAAALLLLLMWRYLRGVYLRGTPDGTERTLALFTMTCFCMFWLRSALTRSDNSHVLGGMLPFLFMASCFLPCYLRGRGLSVSWLALVMAFPLLSVAYMVTEMRHPNTSIPPVHAWALARLQAAGHLEMKGAQLEVAHQSIREAADAARALPGESLYVWPYETMVNSLTGRRIVDATLQSYAATTDGLERATISRLEAMPDVPVLLFTDSFPVDGVENLTRTPQIFRFMLEHYELAEPGRKSFLVLRRSNERNVRWQAWPALHAQSFAPGQGSLKVALPDSEADELRASDLLSLRLRVARTRMLGIRKPGQLSLTLLLSNGEERTQNLLVPPDGEPHEVLVSASTLRDPLFASIFAPRRSWRASERVTGLELRWSRLDLLSAVPSAITLEGLSIMRREQVEMVESTIAEQNQSSLWEWCYSLSR